MNVSSIVVTVDILNMNKEISNPSWNGQILVSFYHCRHVEILDMSIQNIE